MSKLKINGIHTVATSNATGIGTWITDLVNANIPVTVKCVDGTIGMFDIFPLLRQGKPGNVVYRKQNIRATGGVMDVPGIGGDYNGDPSDAADLWWHYFTSEFPPELIPYKDILWCEFLNEVDREESDWIGWFCYHIGLLALRDGFKWIGPGWFSGGPEYNDWQTPGFLAYLRLCADNPGKLGLSLHEYSYTLNIWDGYPYLVGRFQFIKDVCDDNGIDFGNIAILLAEWGWEYQNIPPIDEALRQIAEIGEVYAQYPNVLGVSLWCLPDESPEWGDIGNQVKALMPGWKNLLMNTEYPDPSPPEPPDMTPEERLVAIAEANRVIDYNADSALQREMVADGYMPYGNEVYEEIDGVQYAVRGGERVDTNIQHKRTYYCIVPQWDNVQYIQQSGGNGEFRFTHWPTNFFTVTQRWANNPDYYGQFGLPGHEGLDIRATSQSPIMSVADGVVTDVNHDPNIHNYGIFVRVDHIQGYQTTYAHLHSISVNVGDTVLGGDVLGLADSTGNSSGSHLHLTLKRPPYTYTDVFGEWPHYICDPTSYLEALGGNWPPPVDPPGQEAIDMLSFMKGDARSWVVVQHPPYQNGNPGPTEDFRNYDYGNGTWVMAKGSNGEWWMFDNDFIYLFEDTSPAPDPVTNEERFYRVDPGKWCRRFQAINQTFQDGGHRTQFYSKNTCQPLDSNSGDNSNNTTVLSVEDNFTFDTYGQPITLDKVLKVKGNTETHWFAIHNGISLGRVAWESDWGRSEIVELYFDRPQLAEPPRRYCQ